MPDQEPNPQPQRPVPDTLEAINIAQYTAVEQQSKARRERLEKAAASGQLVMRGSESEQIGDEAKHESGVNALPTAEEIRAERARQAAETKPPETLH